MNENPYQSPQYVDSNFTASNDPSQGGIELVSQGKRFVTYLVDRVVMSIASFAVGIVLGIALVLNDPDPSALDSPGIDFVGILIGFVVVFFYYVFFEALFQRTPGKFATGTKVVNKSGGKPSFPQILGRTACRFIPFEAFSFLFGDSKNVVGWHDSLSNTYVVSVKSQTSHRS